MLLGIFQEEAADSLQLVLIQFDLQSGSYKPLDTVQFPYSQNPELVGEDDQFVLLCVHDKNMGVS
jgi:hypothetical protein